MLLSLLLRVFLRVSLSSLVLLCSNKLFRISLYSLIAIFLPLIHVRKNMRIVRESEIYGILVKKPTISNIMKLI